MKKVKNSFVEKLKLVRLEVIWDFSWSIKIDLYWTIRKENSKRKLLKNEQIQPCKQVGERRKTTILRLLDLVINSWKTNSFGHFRTKATSGDISKIIWPALHVKGIKLGTVTPTLPIAKTISAKNARAWVTMAFI